MVNPGHRSRGCWTCRTRRIKCDESYPACLRCVKSRRICLRHDNSSPSTSRSEMTLEMARYAHHKVTTKKPHIAYTALIDIASFFTNDSLHVGSLSCLGRPSNPWNPDQFATFTTEVVTLGFHSLQSPSQSAKSRRSLHQKYGLAIHHLRITFLSRPNGTILFTPILLFALYEVKSSL